MTMMAICPLAETPVEVDRDVWLDAIGRDRCPLSGAPLEPFERTEGDGRGRSSGSLTVGRCPRGCWAEWWPAENRAGVVEPNWRGHAVFVEVDDDGVDEE